jgi:hypothetical protein
VPQPANSSSLNQIRRDLDVLTPSPSPTSSVQMWHPAMAIIAAHRAAEAAKNPGRIIRPTQLGPESLPVRSYPATPNSLRPADTIAPRIEFGMVNCAAEHNDLTQGIQGLAPVPCMLCYKSDTPTLTWYTCKSCGVRMCVACKNELLGIPGHSIGKFVKNRQGSLR